ncbi:MAG TPA: tRNA (guanosine(37)-N1)-methyltransferase TrmD [Patescibacteria group bacterium]|jgi:tRNA (guanine37-N1)-methyltransferase|nr:tRNA (guanosine(37)-N1)-methyltransferase TrmD [Patescibacteria group bacterium]
MKISIITLFPEMFGGPFDSSIIKRAIDKKLVEINFVNLRDFGLGAHKTVDDTPYGGGKGMILKVDVLQKAIEAVKDKKLNKKAQKVILLSAHGKQFAQKKAQSFSKLKNLILVCGHYEGFDERVKKFIDEEVSVGDFILTGGEIPAILITDAVLRLVGGVIKEDSAAFESFSPYLEYPQYTKPQVFNHLKVPEVLLSGNHAKVSEWRKKESLRVTAKLRPDLIKKH